MKVIRNGVWIKTVPKKYESVIEGFVFKSESKRLKPTERFELITLLILNSLNNIGKSSSQQRLLAAEKLLKPPFVFDIIRVDRRDFIEWRISKDGFEINVDSELVSDCPDKYLTHRKQF